MEYHVMTRDVEKVLEVLVPHTEQGPDGTGTLVDVPRLPLSSVVTQECAIKARVCVLHQFDLYEEVRYNGVRLLQRQLKNNNNNNCIFGMGNVCLH